jgi:hypothetical protein
MGAEAANLNFSQAAWVFFGKKRTSKRLTQSGVQRRKEIKEKGYPPYILLRGRERRKPLEAKAVCFHSARPPEPTYLPLASF